MSIYLLAVLGNFQEVMCLAGTLVTVGLLASGTWAFVQMYDSVLGDPENVSDTFKKRWCLAAGLAVLLFSLAASIPTRRGLIEAYLIIEGRELISGENARQAFERFDKVLDRLAGEEKSQ